MDLVDIEHEIARLDAIYRPVATKQVDVTDLDSLKNVGAVVRADPVRLAVDEQAQSVLRATIELYGAGDDTLRAAIRLLFDRYRSFRWAANLPRDWDTAAEFRTRLLHLSARDQGSDTRDEILALQDLCDQARQAGIDVDPVLDEVAAISSDTDQYEMGSMRALILGYGKRRTG